MSYIAQTPQRPLPGAYIQTPAASKYQPSLVRQPFPRSNSSQTQPQNEPQMSTQALILQSDSSVPAEKPAAESLKPVDRAAKTVNDTLRKESAYPELDNYVGRK